MTSATRGQTQATCTFSSEKRLIPHDAPGGSEDAPTSGTAGYCVPPVTLKKLLPQGSGTRLGGPVSAARQVRAHAHLSFETTTCDSAAFQFVIFHSPHMNT